MGKHVIYLGDTTLDTAAAYLASLMTHWGWKFEYAPSHQSPGEDFLDNAALLVLSDYPAEMLSQTQQERAVAWVESGGGLLMCGGWESYHGTGGDWDTTPLSSVLPVEMQDADDRVNCGHPVFAVCDASHAITDNLPWNDHPPLIGGFNRVTAKPSATVLLEAHHTSARRDGNRFTLEPGERDLLLAIGEHGQGRTAALTTDVAPHWIGPMVDWGSERVTASVSSEISVEVGQWYAQFLKQLLNWTGRIE